MSKTGIYIHVPFCARKCPYCDFYSDKFTKETALDYTKAVIRDINAFPDRLTVDTVYFGGGTPSMLHAECLSEILTALRERFELVSPEITLEVNPSTVTEQKLTAYHDMGINRLSFGVQSAIDTELSFLGRLHTFDKAKRAVELAKQVGFDNISCDLMIGIPYQTEDSLNYSIEALCGLPITHISSYMLKIEEGTPFDSEETKKLLPDEETVSDYYLKMVDMLEERGFVQYEISNFSKSGFESRHNLKYWNCEEYVGFGPSAHSYYGDKRYSVPDNLSGFISGEYEHIVTDDTPGQWDERIMLGLRLKKGINVSDYPEKREHLLKKAALFEKAGYMEINGSSISLTPRGFLLSNSIITELIY